MAIIENTCKRTANPMYNLLVVLTRIKRLGIKDHSLELVSTGERAVITDFFESFIS